MRLQISLNTTMCRFHGAAERRKICSGNETNKSSEDASTVHVSPFITWKDNIFRFPLREAQDDGL